MFWRAFVTLRLNNKDQHSSLISSLAMKSFWHHECLFGQTYGAHDSITCNDIYMVLFLRNPVGQAALKEQNIQKQGWHIFSRILLIFYGPSHGDLVFFPIWGTFSVSAWTDMCTFPGNTQRFTSGANSF